LAYKIFNTFCEWLGALYVILRGPLTCE
jgi:hypothetical protein